MSFTTAEQLYSETTERQSNWSLRRTVFFSALVCTTFWTVAIAGALAIFG
tara:strand:+ start:185440 stop:185589 length:150 start_codon:yes stop_codon:yes gene_type:complete